LQQLGPNAVPKEGRHPAEIFLKRLWGPAPWMLEASLILESVIGRSTQVIIIGLPLILNAFIGFFGEDCVQNAPALSGISASSTAML
jgi:H+-transporting ATPase